MFYFFTKSCNYLHFITINAILFHFINNWWPIYAQHFQKRKKNQPFFFPCISRLHQNHRPSSARLLRRSPAQCASESCSTIVSVLLNSRWSHANTNPSIRLCSTFIVRFDLCFFPIDFFSYPIYFLWFYMIFLVFDFFSSTVTIENRL